MCSGPLTAYHAQEKVDGKYVRKGITFNRNASYSGVPIQIGCGQCIECRMKAAREMAIRALHESKMHPYSQFVTLTYDNAHLPHDFSLDHRDFQLFMKRLRKSRGFDPANRIKYFMCGEYGDENYRPHYHAILYNVRFPDKKLYRKSSKGLDYFTSIELSELWGQGLVVFGKVEFQSCAYVSGYLLKKAMGKNAWMAYCDVDANGVVSNEVAPEYRKLSNGLGKSWFEKYGSHAFEHDSIIINAKEVRPPRYYDLLFEKDPKNAVQGLAGNKLTGVKRRRAILARSMRADNTPRRKRVKEIIALKRLNERKKQL